MFQKLSVKTVQLISWYVAGPEDSEEQQLKKVIGVGTIFVGLLSWLGYSLLFISFNAHLAGWVCISIGVLFSVIFLSYRIFRHYTFHWYCKSIVHILGILLLHFIFGGFAQSGMVMIWILVPPFETLVVQKPRHGLMMCLAVAIVFIIVTFLQPYYPPPTNKLPSNLVNVLFTINTLGMTIFVSLAVYYFVWQNEILSNLVLTEQRKGEALLLNILPREIVAILKDENRVIADQFDNTSILFADVVNFTPMSATMTPTELVELLNEVYSSFDALVEKYDLEKIKTIGDCYMVAAGVPRRRPDHAFVITKLALDIRDYVSQHEFCGHKLTFRIGINSGSVVAGVIGRKKFIYDLWGDAVNTASRMESHSASGSIQVTETTYNLIKEEFVCDPRGTIQVKGKGEMPVWFVIEKR